MAATRTPAAVTNTALLPDSQETGRQGLKFDFPLAGTTVFVKVMTFEPWQALFTLQQLASDEMDMPERLVSDGIGLPRWLMWAKSFIPQKLMSGGTGDYADSPGAVINGERALGFLDSERYPREAPGEGGSGPFLPFFSSGSGLNAAPAAQDDGGGKPDSGNGSLYSGTSIIQLSEQLFMGAPQQTGGPAGLLVQGG